MKSFITLFMVGVLIVIFAIAATIVPNFYKAQNIINLVANNWFVIILGIGVTFLLITGNFDMSVGGVVALTGVLCRLFLPGKKRIPESPGQRAWTALWRCRRPGITLRDGCRRNQRILHRPLEGPFYHHYTGHDDAGTWRGPGDHAGCTAQYQSSQSFGVLGSLGIPGTSIRIAVLVMIVFVLVAFIVEKKTAFGRRIYLIGANNEAARLSGINVSKYLSSLYILSALLAGITGILHGVRVQGRCFQPGNGL